MPAVKNKRAFSAETFLATMGVGRTILSFQKKEMIFSQGGVCDAIFFIQKGKVKLTVVSGAGKEATIGIVGEGYFFGEDCLAGQSVRLQSASSFTACTVLRINKAEMVQTLHSEHQLADKFVEYLLSRNLRYQEDLVDQLFNSSEKRLARILLVLARFGKDQIAEWTIIPKISQETLAEMVGTTRSRVSFFMNKFRKLGFIKYNGRMEVHSSMLNVVLHD